MSSETGGRSERECEREREVWERERRLARGKYAMSRRRKHVRQSALDEDATFEFENIDSNDDAARARAHATSDDAQDGNDAATVQEVAVVRDTPGGNILEVFPSSSIKEWLRLRREKGEDASESGNESEQHQSPQPLLCRLPARFVKTLWVRRGSFVIVKLLVNNNIGVGNESNNQYKKDAKGNTSAKVRGEVAAVIMPKQMKTMRKCGQW